MSSDSVSTVRCVLYLAICCSAAGVLDAQAKAPLTPEACTGIRYLAPNELISRPSLQLSHDGKQVAYVTQTPDLKSNDYKEELYVARLDGETQANSKPVMVNDLVAALSWFPDNRSLAVLIHQHGKTVLARVDSATGAYSIIKEAKGDITDYSLDYAGDTIAIAVRVPSSSTHVARTPPEVREGYRVSLDSTAPPYRAARQIHIMRSVDSHRWVTGAPITFTSPLSERRLTTFVDYHFLHINLSPNGRYLLVDNIERFDDFTLQGPWKSSRVVKYLAGRIEGVEASYLYDIQRRTVSMPLESPQVGEGTAWAPDSNSYVKIAQAPVGSKWESADLATAAPTNHSYHLFSVDVRTREIQEVIRHTEKPPIGWANDGALLVEDDTGRIHTFYINPSGWIERDSFTIPLSRSSINVSMASDGRRFVMEHENASTAPEILQFDRSTGSTEILRKLNPQVSSLLLPRIEEIAWTTSTGYEARGVLLLPPDYVSNRRYPLVVENGSILYDGSFVCDSGADHVSSFVRGLLASSGIVYLMRVQPSDAKWKNNYYPSGYPGEIGEAAFQLDLVESAVRYLDGRHIVDPAKVGLIGFSRGGWYTEFALAHSHIHFQAATATDNVLYSTGEYWYLYDKAALHTMEGMYGGPPYGATLKNWLDYSISFNMDKIHTPLLIEVNGYGRNNDDPYRPLNNLAKHYEEFVGLSRLAKPVELYFYPEEQHQVDHPIARITSAQRNIDWFRFWLQGYERANPEDPDQYKRWEHLRELRNADNSAIVGAESIQ